MTGACPTRIASVRAPPTTDTWNDGRLHFVDAGGIPVRAGDWVVVRDATDAGWIAEVVVAPEQLVECPFGLQTPSALPTVVRVAEAHERPPARTAGAGLALLGSLELPTWTTVTERAGLPPSARQSPPEHERKNQQDDG